MPSYPATRLNLIARAKEAADNVWLIAKKQNGIYYLADFDEENNTALWCRRKEQAISFRTEQGVHQYISAYLNSRTDIYLVHARAT